MSAKSCASLMTEDGIKRYIANKDLHNIPIFTYDVIDSTNTRAKLFAKECPNKPAIFIADTQTAGRGRLGRSFDSRGGVGIYISFLIYGDELLKDSELLTVRTAVKIAQAIEISVGISPDIKWVNDLYVGGKKVAGILCEGIFSEDGTSLLGAICGVGINVYKRVFPPEISSIATTLEDTAPVNISREELISKIIEEFFSPDFNILDEYRRRSLVLGKEVRVISAVGEYDAQAISITDKGHLVVKLSDGSEKELSSGEVSIKPKIN